MTKTKSTSSLKTSPSQNNKKRKFKMPGALSIIIGVAFFAIVLSWVVHAIHPTNEVGFSGWYATQYDSWLTGFNDKDRYLVVNATNQFLSTSDGAALLKTHDLTGLINYLNADPDGLLTSLSSEGKIQLSTLNPSLFIDGHWFNFGDSNWYVSNDGMYGIGDIVKASIAGVFSAWDLIFFIVAMGAIIELLTETKVLNSLVNSLIKGMNNKRILLLPILFILFSLWGTILGSQETTLALIPIIVPSLIIAGFDATTGFLVVLLGCTTGIAASVLEPFALGTLASAFNGIWQEAGGSGVIGIGTGIGLRMILFIIYTSIGCLFMVWYGQRVLKGKSIEDKSMIEENKKWAKVSMGEMDHKEMDKKQKIALGTVGFVMLWMIIVFLPWSSWIGDTYNSSGWATFSHLFFFNSLVGRWTFVQLGLLFALGWYICAKVFNYSNNQMKNNWKNSFVTFKVVAFILIFSRATSIILTNSGDADYLAVNLFGTLSDSLKPGALSLVIFPIYILMALFIPSMTGLAGISAPIIAPIIKGYGSPEAMLPAIIGIMTLYPLAQGLVNMSSPTTGLVIAQAEASRASYAKAFPFLLGYAITLAVVGVVMVTLFFFMI